MRDLWFALIAVASNRNNRGLLISPYSSTDTWNTTATFLPLYWPDFNWQTKRLVDKRTQK